MTVTYIRHSAFLVETDSACLLFDWYEEAPLPPIPEGKPLYVLASHGHWDHFGEAIFDLLKGREKVTYLLSHDIQEDLPENLPQANVHFLQPHVLWQDEILTVEPFRSTDLGIAFWCGVDGKRIYHAGDLNHWYWEGEDEQWNRDMTRAYRTEIGRMAGYSADAAFLPVDPRQGDWFYLGADDFLRTVPAEHIFPMHLWEDYSLCEKFREHPCAQGYRDRIALIREQGQRFTL